MKIEFPGFPEFSEKNKEEYTKALEDARKKSRELILLVDSFFDDLSQAKAKIFFHQEQALRSSLEGLKEVIDGDDLQSLVQKREALKKAYEEAVAEAEKQKKLDELYGDDDHLDPYRSYE